MLKSKTLLAVTCALVIGAAVAASASADEDRSDDAEVACITMCGDIVEAVLEQTERESMSNRDGVVTETEGPAFDVHDDIGKATREALGCITDCLDALK